jgi:endoglycosylceramidase
MYALPMDLGQPYEGAARERIDASVELWSRNVRVVGERLGAPVVLGEFGLDMSGPGAPEFVSRMLAETESMAAGRVYWSNDHDGWGPWEERAEGEDLTPGPLAHVMNRAYPRAVAGRPLELGPHDADGALSVRYAENGASGATELYLPEDVFGQGFDLTVDTPAGDDGWTSRWDGGRRILHVTVTGAADGDETVLTVAPS